MLIPQKLLIHEMKCWRDRSDKRRSDAYGCSPDASGSAKSQVNDRAPGEANQPVAIADSSFSTRKLGDFRRLFAVAC
jgi:hypothetical protein